MCLSAPRQPAYQPTTTPAPARVDPPARPTVTTPTPTETAPGSGAVEPRVGERRRRATGIFSNIRTSSMGDPLFGGNTIQRATFGGSF